MNQIKNNKIEKLVTNKFKFAKTENEVFDYFIQNKSKKTILTKKKFFKTKLNDLLQRKIGYKDVKHQTTDIRAIEDNELLTQKGILKLLKEKKKQKFEEQTKDFLFLDSEKNRTEDLLKDEDKLVLFLDQVFLLKNELKFGLKNYLGNAKFDQNPINKNVLVGFRNNLLVINPNYYLLYLRRAFLFVLYNSKNFSKSFTFLDKQQFLEVRHLLKLLKQFGSGVYVPGFLSNAKNVVKFAKFNIGKEGLNQKNFIFFDKYNYPDYCFLFNDTKNFAFMQNECVSKKLPFISLNNSIHGIGISNYTIISNNTGFNSSLYFTKFFFNIIKNGLEIKKFELYKKLTN